MIIRCPSCDERISNKNTACPHCEFDLQGTGEGLSYDQAIQRRNRDRAYRLAMLSYGALALTTVGAIWSWFSSREMSESPGLFPSMTMAAGAVWYIVVRVMMFFFRKRKSE